MPYHTSHRNVTSWCNFTTVLHTAPNHIPLQLPQGIFLICGDRVWLAIPSNVEGCPCSFGRLTLLTPHLKMIKEQEHREKMFIEQYGPDCDDNFRACNFEKRFAAALLLPQAASGAPLKQLNQLSY